MKKDTQAVEKLGSLEGNLGFGFFQGSRWEGKKLETVSRGRNFLKIRRDVTAV